MSSSYPSSYSPVGSSSGTGHSQQARARRRGQFPPKPKSVRFWKVLSGQELEAPKVTPQDSHACTFAKPRFISVLGCVLFLGAILGLGVLLSLASLQEFFSPASPVNTPE